MAEKKYTGVSWNQRTRKYRVKLQYKGVTYLDTYVDTAKEGALQRDKLIIRKNLNVPLQVLTSVNSNKKIV